MPSSVADLATLGKMLEEHRPRLLAMLRLRTDAAAIDPEDLLQDTFLLARRRWQQFKEQARMTPYAWLYRLALDCLIEEWRRRNRAGRDREMPLPERSSVLMLGALLRPGTSPSAAMAREEDQEQMRQILGLLKESDREILWMRHYDELSFKETATLLGVSENTAAQRYVRALRRRSLGIGDGQASRENRREGDRSGPQDDKRLLTVGIDSVIFTGPFSLDGTRWAWGHTDGSVTVCDIPAVQRRLAEIGLGW